jgi:hypothetical protein
MKLPELSDGSCASSFAGGAFQCGIQAILASPDAACAVAVVTAPVDAQEG